MLSPEIWDVIDAVHYRPAVSIILPFNVKINLNAEVNQKLNIVTDQVEAELNRNYPDEICVSVLDKLKKVVENIILDTEKKSMAIYVSPVFEKVIFMDRLAKERIIIDDSFEIRDLVYDLKNTSKYLVLLVSAKQSRIYLCNNSHFVRIIPEVPESAAAYINDTPERVSNFTDVKERKQTLINKFLSHIDKEIEQILKAHQLPFFVLGTKKTIGHFRKVTKHDKEIIAYIYANCDKMSTVDLKNILKPGLELWKRNKQENLLKRLEQAAGKGNLILGIKEIWQEISNQRSGILIVESNYVFAAQRGPTPDIITEISEPNNEFSYIRDAVDDVIEKILLSGGDIEFTDPGILESFNHIALIAFN